MMLTEGWLFGLTILIGYTIIAQVWQIQRHNKHMMWHKKERSKRDVFMVDDRTDT